MHPHFSSPFHVSASARWAVLPVFILCCCAWVRADQDDNDNNADLQPSLEQIARNAVLKRWPDATDLEVADLTDEDDDCVPDENAADPKNQKQNPDDVAAEDQENDDDGSDCTVSVTFVTSGRELEAWMDDTGKIEFVYEAIPLETAPKNIVDAARSTVEEGDILYLDKVLDETQQPAVVSYTIGIGDKEVHLDADGGIINVEDMQEAPDEDKDYENEIPAANVQTI